MTWNRKTQKEIMGGQTRGCVSSLEQVVRSLYFRLSFCAFSVYKNETLFKLKGMRNLGTNDKICVTHSIS